MNKNPLLKDDALSMGATITDNSAAKSFMIKTVEGKPSKPDINIINWGRMKHQFYTRKNREKKTVYTEKRAYGINTLGELEGITAKGWLSQQRRAFQPFKTLKTKKVGFNMDMRDMMNNQNKMMEKMLKGGIR